MPKLRKLRHESLETRRVLASDLGQIAGVVDNDLAGDGSSTIFAAGQTVELYIDDGDTTFDPVSGGGGDVLSSSTTTDANGEYSFDNLVENDYFIRIVPISGTQLDTGDTGVSSLITFNATEVMGTTNITVDDFTTAQTVTMARGALDTGTVSNDGTVDNGSISGGEQDLLVEVTDGVGSVTATSGFNNGSSVVLTLSSDSAVNGRLTATWDGDDNDGATVDHSNLSLDLTGAGANTGFALSIATDQPDGNLTLRVFSGAGNSSEATFALTGADTDGVIDGSTGEGLTFNFADFVTALGTGVDFTDVTAIQLELDFTGSGENGLDAQIEVLGVVGFVTKTADFTVFNEMSIGDQVWIDLDNDGVFEAGESGIQNVAVTLYEDTDGDGDYLDETALDTALTDASGNYLFTGLLPSDYIVQIDASNFTGGGVLEGLASSTGNDVSSVAPDPDTDVNSTDKGTLAGDSSVVTLPITLVGNSEPTNDGDTDNNTNRTVDFGFFGYDLVIAKTVDQATAGPNDTLVYTIIVTNDGPSTATNVDFTDTLPAGVTFVSGTTNVGGQTVTGSTGSSTVTSTIGTLLSGATATITINATIDAATIGTLTNTAATSGDDESNTTNNSDTAQTTVVPEIDLAITKADDDNDVTLAPDDTIAYTLVVTNNGPSDATGVTVTDLLPTGLTFVSTGSTTPATTTSVSGGTQLDYTIGNLASGASTTLTINAQIGSTFAGTLTNTASVTGNETETDSTNNSDTAQSLVAVPPASIAGTVYVDLDDDGVFDSNEIPISGVLITLTGTDFNSNPVTATTTTDVNGNYSFTNLLPGTYQVVETQPTFFPDGQDTATFGGATVGSDVISTIVLTAGDNAISNNFGELQPTLTKRNFFASNIN